MVDTDTFLTELYVMADDFCKSQLPDRAAPGPKPSLTNSEVITLLVFSQWARFRSERDFYRYAQSRLRPAFPTLPRRSQFNRLARNCYGLLAAFSRHLADSLQGQHCLYEALDSSAVPTRCVKRRGAALRQAQEAPRTGGHWLEQPPGLVPRLPPVAFRNPRGDHHRPSAGSGFGRASAADRALAGDFFAFRHTPHPRLPTLGAPARGCHLADKGFEGRELRKRWQDRYGARVIHAPKRNSKAPWPRTLRLLSLPKGAGRKTADSGNGVQSAASRLRNGAGAPASTGRLSDQAGGQNRAA